MRVEDEVKFGWAHHCCEHGSLLETFEGFGVGFRESAAGGVGGERGKKGMESEQIRRDTAEAEDGK